VRGWVISDWVVKTVKKREKEKKKNGGGEKGDLEKRGIFWRKLGSDILPLTKEPRGANEWVGETT